MLPSARAALARGSSSFDAAARLMGGRMRESVTLLYAWCRHCDDVIDGQVLGHGAGALATVPLEDRLAGLRAETTAALQCRASPGTVFAGLATVAQRHAIPPAFPLDLLEGFAMDAAGREYRTVEDTLDYAYHVAGSVGVMMANVMGVHDLPTLRRACDLGIAFQLSNIARDVMEDAGVGRVYLPRNWLEEARVPPDRLDDPAHRAAVAAVVARLLDVAEPYYASARAGIGALPFRAGCAVAAARGIYREIGVIVRARGPDAWQSRAATTRWRKLRLAAEGCAVAAIERGPSWVRAAPPRDGLFTPASLFAV